jgi:hypothetical protein
VKVLLLLVLVGCVRTNQPRPSGVQGCIMACSDACFSVTYDDKKDCIVGCVAEVSKVPACQVPTPAMPASAAKVEAEPVPVPPPSGE